MNAALGLILLSAWSEAAGLGLLALVFGGRLPGRGWPERLGLGYLLGLGVVCWLTYLWMFAGLPLRPAGVVALTLPLIAGGAWRAWAAHRDARASSADAAPQQPAMLPLSRIVYWSLVLVCSLAVVLQTLWLMQMPLHGWDALHLWGYKTQILLHRGAVWTEEYTNAAVTNTPRTYPHFLPIAQMWHARAAGPLIEGGAWKLFFGLLQGAFLAVFYGMVRRRLAPLAAMAVTALVATMPHFVNLEDGGPVSGYADVMLAAYYFLAAGAVWRWLEEGDRRWLAVGALATGLCYFAKREGVLALALNGAAVLALSGGWSWRDALRRKLGPALLFGALLALIAAPVWAFARAVEVEPDLVGEMLRNLTWERFLERVDRLWYSLSTVGRYLFLNPHTWALAWWGLVVISALRLRAVVKPATLFMLIVAAVPVINFCIVAVVTIFHLEGLHLVTFPRMIQSTIAPVFFYLALMLAPWLPGEPSNDRP